VKWPSAFWRLIGCPSTSTPQEKLRIRLETLINIFSGESDRFLLVGKKAGKAGADLPMHLEPIDVMPKIDGMAAQHS
jgi:hypothetical protein